MTVLLIAGSPSAPSRSAVLLDAVAARLAERGVPVERLAIRELAAHALLLGEASHPSVQHAVEQLRRADVVVIATPVYKAAYSGVLKVFLDLLPQSALKGKTVLPLATGGSPHHMLALDYALRPVLQSLAARQILPGVYATDGQVTLQPEGAYQLQAELAQRLDEAVDTLASEGLKLQSPSRWGFEPVAFSQVRCSV
ncbi:NADPH-dependent FMN reductase [Variovorax sp. J31P207]|uniref:NADPH-dependent FMN reductase n=1 Tax=Variovorax sp. J31P207 TaxID=3053510 RepID=UPI00257548C9|nr:NADPH-dependent FMN reductase [Variovorax sp. J31P207]MDM0071367.1 NADPH-dependent FMN reductase [Variovorax sp. J31P207]